MRSANDRHILFFENNSRDTGQSLFFAVQIHKLIPMISLSTNRLTTNFQIKENGLGFRFPFETAAYTVYIYICAAVSIHISTYTENRTNRKRQLHIDCCKQKTETAPNFRLFTDNGNLKQMLAFLGRQTINGYQPLLFKQTFPPTTRIHMILCTILQYVTRILVLKLKTEQRQKTIKYFSVV